MWVLAFRRCRRAWSLYGIRYAGLMRQSG